MPILVVFLAVGFGETVGQVLLIRELLINFQGNELSLGVIFACWLLMMSLGSWGLGKFAEKLPPKPSLFAFTIIVYVFILLSQLLLARLVNTIIGVRPGEVAGLASIFYASLIILTPLCLLHGFQFPLACRILATQAGLPPFQVGKVYIAEALGSMVGGALFAYFLVHCFDHLEIAGVAVLLNLVAGVFLLRPVISRQLVLFKVLVCFLSLTILVSLSSGFLSKLDFTSAQWQWRGHQLVSSRNSVYQNIAVTKKGEQLNFFANGALLFITPVPDIKFAEEISHFPLLYHPSPKKVLLIGGGVGGVLEELTKHPVDSVLYVEPDPLIIKTAERYLSPNPLDDVRIKVEYTDGRLFIEKTIGKFDVVIMNLPPPSTLQVNRFYTQEFFKKVRDILVDQGIFAFGLPSSEVYMTEEMIRLNRSIFSTLKRVFPALLVIPDDFTIFLASVDPALLTQDTGQICYRLEERRLRTKLFTLPYVEYKFLPERVSRLTAYLNEAGEINQDQRPIGTFHNLALWNAMFHPKLRGIFDFVLSIKLWWLLPLLPLFFLPILSSLRQRRFPVSSIALALFTTGFAGMTFTIVLLFTFQVSYGYLYHKIGILIAAFMLGLALGGWVMNRVMGKLRRDVLTLGWIELGVAFYAFSLPWLVFLLGGFSSVPGEVPFCFLNLGAGFLTGLEFPLASKIYLQRATGVAPVVGLLYAADLWGSVLGALLASVLFVPVLGVINTCLMAGMLNLATFALLFASKPYFQMPGM